MAKPGYSGTGPTQTLLPLTPDCEPHTPEPVGYLQWHEWAARMGKTHTQRQCKGCGRWVIWEPKGAVGG